MGTHRPPPDPDRSVRRRAGPVPATTGGRALAACRERLHNAVALLVEANTTLRGTVAARDRTLLELREAERAQDAFVVAAVHELKTPLTAVKGRAQLIQRRTRSGAGFDPIQVADGFAEIEAAAGAGGRPCSGVRSHAGGDRGRRR